MKWLVNWIQLRICVQEIPKHIGTKKLSRTAAAAGPT